MLKTVQNLVDGLLKNSLKLQNPIFTQLKFELSTGFSTAY